MIGKFPCTIKRKAWSPTPGTSSLVITLPRVAFIERGDKFNMIVDEDRIILEKVPKEAQCPKKTE